MTIPEIIEQISLIISKNIERIIRYTKKYKIYILVSVLISILVAGFIINQFKSSLGTIIGSLITLYIAILSQFIFVAYKEIQKENMKKEELEDVDFRLNELGKHPDDVEVKDMLQTMYRSAIMDNLSKK